MKAQSKKGSVLILAIWVLMLLTVFATSIGLRVRQRVTLISRIENRSHLHFLTEAGIKKAIAAIRYDSERFPLGQSPDAKKYRFNNPDVFEFINLETGKASVSYTPEDATIHKGKNFGVIDEERKINLNTVDRITLFRLIEQLTDMSEAYIRGIVESIIDWREITKTQLVGFRSDEYYSNLPEPYPNKNAPIEIFEELLLIQGMNEDLYNKLKPFVTIYGDGLINVNTASKEVLIALGLQPHVADKFLQARRGPDGEDATLDDHIFKNSYDVTREVQNLVDLEKEEVIQIDFLNGAGKIKTISSYYLIESFGTLEGRKESLHIACIYNARDNIIEYWRENN